MELKTKTHDMIGHLYRIRPNKSRDYLLWSQPKKKSTVVNIQTTNKYWTLLYKEEDSSVKQCIPTEKICYLI